MYNINIIHANMLSKKKAISTLESMFYYRGEMGNLWNLVIRTNEIISEEQKNITDYCVLIYSIAFVVFCLLSAFFLLFQILQSITFILIFMLYSTITSLPWSLYETFVLEERHGFNKQVCLTYTI